jgi:hypothetical protein
MLPTGTVEGQIVGTDLYRFEGREVRVSSHVMRQSTPPRAGRDVPLPVYFDTGDATTLVDREGRFRIPVIAAGQVFISLSNPPESEWVSQGSATVVLKEGETKKVEFASARKVGFEGKVEHSDGSPAEGARIEIHNGKRWQIVNTVAGADGTFQCQVCPGELTTKARIETFAGVKVIFPLVGAENITRVAADSTNNVAKTLRLPGLVLVEGEARDKTGMVIGGSSINLSRPKGGFLNIQAGPDGRFRIYRPENVPLTEFSVKVDRQPAVIRETAGELTVIQVEE